MPTVLAPYSVKDLYPLALAEGEGMGTAYEYVAKRLRLGRWLAAQERPRSLLVAGLPERYGLSLDFLLLAAEWGAAVTVVDDRAERLAQLEEALGRVTTPDGRPLPRPAVIRAAPEGAVGLDVHDLGLSSEVLQRLEPRTREQYVARLRSAVGRLALFVPNADNPAHTTRSGLSGLGRDELARLVGGGEAQVGYVDMPPFPPGITRSDAQREQATQGLFEAAVMWGLGGYARAERRLPEGLRRRQSHIVYAFLWS
jgi:NAD(P)-dependent dehydrogenase (short-subunit alcohol dehydrogenase family)